MRKPMPAFCSDRSIALVACMLVAGAVGCAGWAPWKDPKESAKLAERYGMTAKQRIADLDKRAKAAKSADAERQAAFTRELAQSILSEHDPRVREQIVTLASRFDTPAAMAICEGALQDPEPRVRIAACDAWQVRGGDRGLELIAARCRAESDIDVRLRAIKTLGGMKNQAAIPVLAESLEDPDPAVQYRAVAALRSVSGRDLGDDVNAWREWAAADPADRDKNWSIAETIRKIF